MSQFYELQLILLTGFCIFSLLLERHASKQKRSLTKAAEARSDPERLENGHGRTASIPGGGRAMLTKKYLIVYAIVMGECCFKYEV